MSVVVGGITNSLFKATFCASDQPAVLVRVFGGEGMIDRDLENATFKALSDSGVGTEYFGRLQLHSVSLFQNVLASSWDFAL